MLIWEFIFLSVSLVVQTSCLIIIYLLSKKSPVFEWKILVLTFGSEVIFHVFWLLVALFSNQNSLDEYAITYFRIGWFFTGLAFLFWAFALVLPTFKANYSSIILLTIIIMVDFSLGIINLFSFNIHILNEFIKITFHPLGMIFFILAFIVYILPSIKRDYEIRQVLSQSNKSVSFFSPLRIFTFLFVIMFSSGFIGIIEELALPGTTFALFFSIQNGYFTFILLKDEAFFFVTPAQLHAVLVVEQTSGLVLFSKSYKGDLPADDLLGGLLTALNVSLMETIQTKKSIEQITFGDKVIQISPGEIITSILILSEKNFITSSLTNFVTKSFEYRFKELLTTSDISEKYNTDNFKLFEGTLNEVKKYLPL